MTIVTFEEGDESPHVPYTDNGDGTYTPIINVGTLASSASISAGENYIGSVGGNSIVVNATPVLTVHATYVTGDYVGTSATPITFSGCARTANDTGLITRAILIDYANQSVAGELWLFDQTVTPPNDSAAWSISDADAAKCIGVIPFSTYYASALNSISFGVPAAPMSFQCTGGTQVLYGCFVTRGAPAYASGDLTFRLSIIQD
jgi:hypothetical protein